MLSLTRAIAWRVPLVTFKSAAPIILQRSPFFSLSSYRTLFTSSSLFAAARVTATSRASKTVGRTKVTKTKAKAKSNAKVKVKAKPKAKAKPKRKVAAKSKSKAKVSTRVPLALRPPKRPPTPFLLYYSRTYPTSASRPGGITSTSKEAGEAWHKLPDSEKQAFHHEAKILLVNYKVQRDKWYRKPENLELLRTINKDRKKRGKKKIHAPTTVVPKRPLPAFMRFTQELRDTNKLSHDDAPEGTNGSKLMWAAREAGMRWKGLADSEKEKYTKAYHADLAKFKATNATAAAAA